MTTKNPAIKMQPAFDFKSLIAVLGIAVLIGIFATIGTSHQPPARYGIRLVQHTANSLRSCLRPADPPYGGSAVQRRDCRFDHA